MKLLEIRKLKGLSQKELQDKTLVFQSRISDHERGKAQLNKREQRRIEKKLNLENCIDFDIRDQEVERKMVKYVKPLEAPKIMWPGQKGKTIDTIEMVKNHLEQLHGEKHSQTILQNMSGVQVLRLAEKLMRGEKTGFENETNTVEPLSVPKFNWS